MKITIYGLISSLIVLIFACRQPDDPANGRPRIKSVSFVGIPDESVRFDPPNGKITVQLPPVLPNGLKPIFDLTDGAQVVNGLTTDSTVDLTQFCVCATSSQPRKVIIRLRNQLTTTVYELYVFPAGTLNAQQTSEQFTFSRKTGRLYLPLPVQNLYTNPYVNLLVFTNLATGAPTPISADAVCLSGCVATAPDRLVFSLGPPIERELTPGTYSVSFNGIDFPQRLVVTD